MLDKISISKARKIGINLELGEIIKGRFILYHAEPFPASYKDGRALRSKVVWWINTGEVLRGYKYNLHHKNENPLDDRFENFQKLTHGDHIKLHQSKPLVECKCVICKNVFYLPQWRINQGRGLYCSQPCSKKGNWLSEERHKKQSKSLKLAYVEGRR